MSTLGSAAYARTPQNRKASAKLVAQIEQAMIDGGTIQGTAAPATKPKLLEDKRRG